MAKRTLPIEFKTSTATEHGDGVLIHWTAQHEPNQRVRMVCASVEGTRPIPKRVVKYLKGEGR